jgi:hypothetical protein
MGSFNVKCSLSGKDIVAGDPVVLLLGLRPNPHKDYCGGWYGPNHYLILQTTPIFGEYNDYGWIEAVDHFSWNLAMKALAITTGDESWKGKNPDSDDSDFRDSFNQHGWDDEESEKVIPVMAWIHKPIWDAVLATHQIHHDFLSIDTTGKFKIEDLIEYMLDLGGNNEGHNSLYDDRYKDKEHHWISVNCTMEQKFKMADWMLARGGFKLPPTKEELRAKYRDSDSALSEELITLLTERSDFEGDQNSTDTHIMNIKLGWWAPMTDHAKTPKVKALLDLSAQEPELFCQAAKFHEALVEARTVVRPATQMPSSGQWTEAGAERIFNAIASAMIKIGDERLERCNEDEDD